MYETNIDPVVHIQHYQQAMFMHTENDSIMCKMFPSSIEKVALPWFYKQSPYSILEVGSNSLKSSWLGFWLAPKTFEVLSSMKQGQMSRLGTMPRNSEQLITIRHQFLSTQSHTVGFHPPCLTLRTMARLVVTLGHFYWFKTDAG